jgi:protein phosphatase
MDNERAPQPESGSEEPPKRDWRFDSVSQEPVEADSAESPSMGGPVAAATPDAPIVDTANTQPSSEATVTAELAADVATETPSADVTQADLPAAGPPEELAAPGQSDRAEGDAAQDTAAPEPVPTAPSAPAELEELTLPSSVTALDPLPEGTTIGPEGAVMVEGLMEKQGRLNRYRATWAGPVDGPLPAELREGPVDHPELRCEAAVLSEVRYAMLPALYATWEENGRRYVAVERVEGLTLDKALRDGLVAEQAVSITLQLAQLLRRLHKAGWALVGLSPDDVQLGQPIRLAHLGTAVRIGEAPSHAMQVPGYSAPELVGQTPVTGKEDVYTLGALLYRAFTGEPIPEQGPELAALATISTTPSSPQLLAPALAPASERIELEEFYQQLLAFKRRLTLAPLALRVASGTSIGLNQTRLTNEDACGYLTWCSAYEGRVAYNAVLCAIDGMGGMDAGEVASTSALRAVLQTASLQVTTQIVGAAGADLETEEEPALGAAVEAEPPARIDPKDLVRAAAEASYTAARGRRVGATITCAVIEDGILTLGHVGDTRAYLLRDGLLTQLTRDHSLVAAMVASGMIMAEEARGHPEQNKVLRSLGGQRTLPPEHIDGLEVAYGTPVLELRNDDQLLFCSDGVWGVLDDDALLDILTNSVDCETAVRVAIRRVLEGGAPDNAAIIVARCTVMPAS